MKKIYNFVGRLGTGKTFLAHEFGKKLNRPVTFIEVGTVVGDLFARETTTTLQNGGVATRQQKQEMKDKMKSNPRFLVDALIKRIDNAPTEVIILSGLREYWIHQELEKRYGPMESTIIESDYELRRQRRGYSEEEFQDAEKRDDAIGVGEYIKRIEPSAKKVSNNFESEPQVDDFRSLSNF